MAEACLTHESDEVELQARFTRAVSRRVLPDASETWTVEGGGPWGRPASPTIYLCDMRICDHDENADQHHHEAHDQDRVLSDRRDRARAPDLDLLGIAEHVASGERP